MIFLNSILKRLNWLLILMHLLAMWLFGFAARQFIMLYDTDFLFLVDKYGFQYAFDQFIQHNDFSPRIVLFSFWIQASPLIGLLTALILSFSINIIRKQFWLNSLLAFLILTGLNRFGFSTSEIVSNVLFSPGNLLASYGLVYKLMANGILLTLPGLLLLFNKYPMRLAANKRHSETIQSDTKSTIKS